MPGLDGSGALWGPLLAELGDVSTERVRYPRDAGRYDAILEAIGEPREPVVVVAESFGGPLAIRLAARCANVRALVLVASFAVAPRRARWLAPLAGLGPHVPPRFALRLALLGGPHPIETELAKAIADVEPSALRERIREVARVDVRAELARLTIPVTWLHARHDRLLGSRADGIDGPHLLAQTRPAAVAIAVRRALAQE